MPSPRCAMSSVSPPWAFSQVAAGTLFLQLILEEPSNYDLLITRAEVPSE